MRISRRPPSPRKRRRPPKSRPLRRRTPNPGANALATANAAATQIVEIAAIATQNAESGANDLATAQARAEAAQATAEALTQSQAVSDSDKATAQAEVANIQATVESVIGHGDGDLATGRLNSIDQGYAEVAIQVDASGLLAGDKDAEDAANRPSRGRSSTTEVVGSVSRSRLAGIPDINRGLAIADKINQLLPDAEPAMFEEAAYENFGNLQPSGTVEIRMYFFRGCQALDQNP